MFLHDEKGFGAVRQVRKHELVVYIENGDYEVPLDAVRTRKRQGDPGFGQAGSKAQGRHPARPFRRTRIFHNNKAFGGMMKKLLLVGALLALALPTQARERWTAPEANAWYAKQKWVVGSNYIPANAINQLEMWQETSFDPAQIDKELGWAQSMGMTTMRVFRMTRCGGRMRRDSRSASTLS